MEVRLIENKELLESAELFKIENLLWGTEKIAKTYGYIGFVPGEGLYIKLQSKRLQKLPHDNQLQGQYHSWKQDHTGRDTDKDTCHEFLGNYRTFTAVQIQKEYS